MTRTNFGRLLRSLIRGESYQERAFGVARRWSNRELAKFGHLFQGEIVNVSGWQDRDKEGKLYRDYFPNKSGYFLTNFGTSQGVMQYTDNEFFLDLAGDLPPELRRRFDVAFNHTTLEHIFDFRRAFSNICELSKDIVILIVPWLQPLHADYGDFWRFSPQAVPRLFDISGLRTLYLSWNSDERASVYVFAIATRNPDKWEEIFPNQITDPWSTDGLKLSENPPGRFAFLT